MEQILSPEIVKAIHALAELIKADERHAVISKASDAYATNDELNRLLTEYGVHQNALTMEYQKETPDEELAKSIQNRLTEIYETVTNHPVYVSFKEASEDYEEFTNEVYKELEFAVTGKRQDCTHDCSTCGGCH